MIEEGHNNPNGQSKLVIDSETSETLMNLLVQQAGRYTVITLEADITHTFDLYVAFWLVS